jgi:hypothetical protein
LRQLSEVVSVCFRSDRGVDIVVRTRVGARARAFFSVSGCL